MYTNRLFFTLKYKNLNNSLFHWQFKQHVRCSPHSCLKLRNFTSYSANEVCIRGIFPPITTPFDKNEEISYERLKDNVSKMEKIPFKGYVVLGSTGEVVSLSLEERLNVVKTVKNAVSSNKLVIAGSGMECTKNTIELTKKMAEVGANAALVITPSFYKGRMSDDALITHYSKIADSSPIPIILYSVPANTSIDLSPFVITKLASHPNIIGLKDSGGDITKITYIVHKTSGKDFQVIAGSAGFLYPALCCGCVGGIVALGNSLGTHLCMLYELFSSGKHEEARNLQHKLIGPNLAVTRWFGIAGVKKSMELCGYYGGPVRSPLKALSEEEAKVLQDEFKINGFL